FVLAVR
ncbi:acrB/AcrD/AcrF family protein, partial [Vibrio parahaemolyticus V-223/04]